jgi:hypothetical protein
LCIDGCGFRRQEATLEIAPGHLLLVQEVADILAGEFECSTFAAIVEIAGQVGVGQRYRPIRWIDVEAGGVGVGRVGGVVNDDAVRVARNDIGVAGHGRAIVGREVIIAYGEVLRIVPQCLDGIAVIVIHHG